MSSVAHEVRNPLFGVLVNLDALENDPTATGDFLPRMRREVERLSAARALATALGRELGRPGLTVDGEAEALLRSHGWPGNVRELRNVLERAAVFSKATGSIVP
ncbi:MAG: hypothetical protein JNK82_15200 [Myxococcaceae bacterium]|nr:hypothetical protein [Myxococcaceae bacterium]